MASAISRRAEARKRGSRARRPLSFESRLARWILVAALPALLGFAILLWRVDAPPPAWFAFALTLCWPIAVALRGRHRFTYALRTLTNLMESLKEGSYTLRGTHAHKPGVLGEVTDHLNALAASLQGERVASQEAGALLSKVVDEVDIAVLTFDELERLTFINPAGEHLLGEDRKTLMYRPAAALQLSSLLRGPQAATVQRTFPGGAGPWDVRRRIFRQEGRRRHLLVMTDVSRALREEERHAWHQLIRVLGHEINNSLAPIRSTASTLARLAQKDPLPEDWRDDMAEGLELVGKRAESLRRFMRGYTMLARLPPPKKRRVRLAPLVARVAAFDPRRRATVSAGRPLTIEADADQIEQALINLVKNAIDATEEGGGAVTIQWRAKDGEAVIEVIDDGPGLAGSQNLFVPFFTTKPGGSGIGLALGRQIAEAHGGTLTLENRRDAYGCVARLSLPL
ncbi:MAG TPA: ATP-binding protein [Gammaproteobacteria bacterium]|nr:ATP-binding protein [Gammaproteobacteria bacterium]